ncbi:MAG: hypothetical protein ACQEP9_06155 [Bacillota bacterium]|jgi:dihydroorotase-like cyclic amidohydrolase
MCVVIKNANVTTAHGSYKTDIAVKDNRVFPVDNNFSVANSKVIDASKVISASILNSFNSRH